MSISPEVFAILILNLILSIFSIIALFISVKIFLNWDFKSTSKKQYKLENSSYLGSTIIKYTLILKIILFIFFVFTLDKLSNVISGAMCAAGVVDATSEGIYLLMLKLLNIYLFGFWLVINNFDMKLEKLPFTRLKFGFFIVIFILFAIETILEFIMFSSIDVDKLVSCCGTLYSSSSESYISTIFMNNQTLLVGLFYCTFVLLSAFYFIKNIYLYTITNLFYLIISLISLIVFFSSYIYEIPTHNCPFCILQKEYDYIGYLIYILLFGGTFAGLSAGLSKIILNMEAKNFLKYSIILNSFYVLLVSYFVLSYYFKFGVFL